MPFTFLIESDLHFDETIRADKIKSVDKIIRQCEDDTGDAGGGIKGLLCPGDLTRHGWDGSSFCCWKYGGAYDQLTPLKEDYVDVIEDYIPVFLCEGNHDTSVPWPYVTHPVGNYISKRHGGKIYSFDIEDIHFVCLGIYPNEKAIKFLKTQLDHPNIFVFFHYNLEGEWSDWWTEEEKDTFYNVIKDSNIVGIACGHRHQTYSLKWRGINIFSGAGPEIVRCDWDGTTVNVSFF